MSEFGCDNRALLNEANLGAWFHAIKKSPIWAKQIDKDQVVQTLEGEMKVTAGTYLCRGEACEVWPQSRESIEDRYSATTDVDSDGWRKYLPRADAAGVMAAQMKRPFEIRLRSGTLTGKPGDFLVKSYEDEDVVYPDDVWVVDQSLFRQTYEWASKGPERAVDQMTTATSDKPGAPNDFSSGRKDYDLDDDASDLQRCPQLQNVLKVLQETLLPVYRAADDLATRQQRRHGWLVSCAAVFGTLAVLCAIIELAGFVPVDPHVVELVELFAAAAAITAVGLGIWSAFHLNWIAKRFIAEQCRFVKFHLLLNPSQWYGRSAQDVRATVERLMEPQKKAGTHLAHDWMRWRRMIVGRFEDVPENLPDEVARELTAYCMDKRLHAQKKYFEQQAKKRGNWEFITRSISPWCFFLSILAAFLHFLFARLAHANPMNGLANSAAGWTMLLAAALPVIAAGVRTVRSAHEFGRNQLRFEAVSHYLATVNDEIARQGAGKGAIPLLREAEAALDAEHRAWLLLTLESEWFG